MQAATCTMYINVLMMGASDCSYSEFRWGVKLSISGSVGGNRVPSLGLPGAPSRPQKDAKGGAKWLLRGTIYLNVALLILNLDWLLFIIIVSLDRIMAPGTVAIKPHQVINYFAPGWVWKDNLLPLASPPELHPHIYHGFALAGAPCGMILTATVLNKLLELFNPPVHITYLSIGPYIEI